MVKKILCCMIAIMMLVASVEVNINIVSKEALAGGGGWGGFFRPDPDYENYGTTGVGQTSFSLGAIINIGGARGYSHRSSNNYYYYYSIQQISGSGQVNWLSSGVTEPTRDKLGRITSGAYTWYAQGIAMKSGTYKFRIVGSNGLGNTYTIQEVEYTVLGNPNLPSNALGYTGSVQQYIAPATGKYFLSAWGAKGGDYGGYAGGYGAIAFGQINLNKDDVLWVYVGGTGASGGWNGGGAAQSFGAMGGGGTDIRLNGQALTDRIIVAGGGGGAGKQDAGGPGGAGGWNGYTAGGGYPGYGGTQTSGGSSGGGNNAQGTSGQLGQGGSNGGAGGGGGYYGGGTGGKNRQSHTCGGPTWTSGGGGGGSSFVDKLTNRSVLGAINPGNGYAVINYVASAPVLTDVSILYKGETVVTVSSSASCESANTITERGFVYSENANPTVADRKVVVGSGTGSFQTTITGLTAGRSYHIRAYAGDGDIVGYSRDVSTTMLKGEISTFTDMVTAANMQYANDPVKADKYNKYEPSSEVVEKFIIDPKGTSVNQYQVTLNLANNNSDISVKYIKVVKIADADNEDGGIIYENNDPTGSYNVQNLKSTSFNIDMPADKKNKNVVVYIKYFFKKNITTKLPQTTYQDRVTVKAVKDSETTQYTKPNTIKIKDVKVNWG